MLQVLCTPKIFKTWFFIKKYTFTIRVGRVWVVIVFFLLEKQTFNELLKVIGKQIEFPSFTLKNNSLVLRILNQLKIKAYSNQNYPLQ